MSDFVTVCCEKPGSDDCQPGKSVKKDTENRLLYKPHTFIMSFSI